MNQKKIYLLKRKQSSFHHTNKQKQDSYITIKKYEEKSSKLIITFKYRKNAKTNKKQKSLPFSSDQLDDQ